MLNRLIAVLLLGITLPAVAEEHFQWHPSSQWKFITSDLYDFVHAGYTIVAVENSFSSADESFEIFFLQKGKSVRKCIEYHKYIEPRNRSRDVDSGFYCYELVQTHDVD